MFITKTSLSRRTWLKGAGAAIALPFLDSMIPAFTPLAKAAAAPPRRFGIVYVPNGEIMQQFTPSTVGAGFAFTPILQPLEPFKDSLVIVTNLTRSHPGSQVGDHAVSAAGFLTGVWPKRTEAEDVLANTTIDQIVAKQIGQDTPLPSIELAGCLGVSRSGGNFEFIVDPARNGYEFSLFYSCSSARLLPRRLPRPPEKPTAQRRCTGRFARVNFRPPKSFFVQERIPTPGIVTALPHLHWLRRTEIRG